MKAKLVIFLVGTLTLFFVACQGSTETVVTEGDEDFSVGPPANKGDEVPVTPEMFLSLLQKDKTFDPPPIVKNWKMPAESWYVDMKIVDVTEGIEPLAIAKVKEYFDGYEFDGEPMYYFLNAMCCDVDIALEYGRDEYHPGLRNYFFKNLIDRYHRVELSNALPQGTFWFRFMYKDTSAELIGHEVFYIQAESWNNQAIEIDMYFSEVY
jgi:hypothetical protein